VPRSCRKTGLYHTLVRPSGKEKRGPLTRRAGGGGEPSDREGKKRSHTKREGARLARYPKPHLASTGKRRSGQDGGGERHRVRKKLFSTAFWVQPVGPSCEFVNLPDARRKETEYPRGKGAPRGFTASPARTRGPVLEGKGGGKKRTKGPQRGVTRITDLFLAQVILCRIEREVADEASREETGKSENVKHLPDGSYRVRKDRPSGRPDDVQRVGKGKRGGRIGHEGDRRPSVCKRVPPSRLA